MKKTYIIVLILVIAILLVLFLTTKDSKLEAPVLPNTEALPNTADVITDTNIVTYGDTENAIKEFTISGQNFSFTPNSLTVNKGDKVKITFQSIEGFHDFKIDEYGIATKQLKSPNQEVLEFTADKAGSFEYYCSVGTHRAMGMFGTLKVE